MSKTIISNKMVYEIKRQVITDMPVFYISFFRFCLCEEFMKPEKTWNDILSLSWWCL